MKKFLVLLVSICLCVGIRAQVMESITWTAYGLTFDVPKGILIEEDTEDTFLLNNSRFYITLQSLESEDMNKEALVDLLTGLATDDEVQELTPAKDWDLPQFHVVYLKGKLDDDPCYYACLMTKEAGSVFYISIIYNRTKDEVVEKMLKSFTMEEE